VGTFGSIVNGQEKDSFIYLPLLKCIGCIKGGGLLVHFPMLKKMGTQKGMLFISRKEKIETLII